MALFFPSLKENYSCFTPGPFKKELFQELSKFTKCFCSYREEYLANLTCNQRVSFFARRLRDVSTLAALSLPVLLAKGKTREAKIVALISMVCIPLLYFLWDRENDQYRKALEYGGTVRDLALGAKIEDRKACVERLSSLGRVEQLMYVLLLEKCDQERSELATRALISLKEEQIEVADILVKHFGAKVDEQTFHAACERLNFAVVSWMRAQKQDGNFAQGGIPFDLLGRYEGDLTWLKQGGMGVTPARRPNQKSLPKITTAFRTPLEIMIEKGASPLRALYALGLDFAKIQGYGAHAEGKKYPNPQNIYNDLNESGVRVRLSMVTDDLVAKIMKEIGHVKGDGRWSSWEEVLRALPKDKPNRRSN